MSNRISKTDVADVEFRDAEELIADGQTTYRTVGLVSTTAATKRVVISSPGILDRLDNVDEPLQAGDIVVISGNAAAGTYTCAAIINATTFSVVQAIPNSTGGSADFQHPAGATVVGINNTTLSYTTKTTVQGALEDVPGALPVPVQVGNVLFAVDTGQFSIVQPITSRQGWLINEDGILIVSPE
jgi:hypothetical protein